MPPDAENSSTPSPKLSIALTINQWALIYTVLTDFVQRLKCNEIDAGYTAFVERTMQEVAPELNQRGILKD